ncbi:MAG: CopG family antitoxin [Dehalococcoidia bacterium]
MTARSKANPVLPPGLSPAEEARWWDEHRDYWDALETQEECLEPVPVRRTKPIDLRLPIAMIDELKRQAARRALPYQTLIHMWLNERLDAEAREPSPER